MLSFGASLKDRITPGGVKHIPTLGMPRKQLCCCATLKCCFGTSPDLQLPYCLKRPSPCTRSAFGSRFPVAPVGGRDRGRGCGAVARSPLQISSYGEGIITKNRVRLTSSVYTKKRRRLSFGCFVKSSSRQGQPSRPETATCRAEGGHGCTQPRTSQSHMLRLCEAFCTPGLTPRLFRKGVPQHVLSHPLGNAETSRISDYNPNPARRRPHECRRSRVHEHPRLNMRAVNYKISHTAIYSLGSLQARQTCTSSDCHSMKIDLLVRT